ncbi:hypothetical protein LOAG_08088 [Loa loa]|uniref:Uncharacterized protein n=1 Tax=Loa loa TaxID=7209 RepID=A0A1S0TUE7_LOALO|nr:hypothetical protein LOAG_08088 [Loa loa]EFO20403.1 hypothetical protein LOAG_08088 [Loa loa]
MRRDNFWKIAKVYLCFRLKVLEVIAIEVRFNKKNTLVIVAVLLQHSLHDVANYFLVSLASADFLPYLDISTETKQQKTITYKKRRKISVLILIGANGVFTRVCYS